MEHSLPDVSHGGDQHIKENKATESNQLEVDAKILSDTVPISPRRNTDFKVDGWKSGEVLFEDRGQEDDLDTYGEVNMEASISTEDVTRAGGFGARDDISSFLPVASDSTDFEASILNARDYEEPQGEHAGRLGLGWTKESKPE